MTSASDCTDPPEAKLTTLANGVFVGGFDDSADERFVLLTRDGSDGLMSTQYGRLIRWQGVAAAARPTGVTLFAPEYGCSSADRRAGNGTDLAEGSQDAPNGQRVVVGLTGYVPASASVAGTVRSLAAGSSARPFTSGVPGGVSYQAWSAPKLADIAGDWTLADAAGRPGGLSVAKDGSVTGSLQGCTISGTLAAATDGLNLFAATLAASGCGTAMAGLTEFTGHAVVLPLAGGDSQLMLWAEANNGVDFRYLLATGGR